MKTTRRVTYTEEWHTQPAQQTRWRWAMLGLALAGLLATVAYGSGWLG